MIHPMSLHFLKVSHLLGNGFEGARHPHNLLQLLNGKKDDIKKKFLNVIFF